MCNNLYFSDQFDYDVIARGMKLSFPAVCISERATLIKTRNGAQKYNLDVLTLLTTTCPEVTRPQRRERGMPGRLQDSGQSCISIISSYLQTGLHIVTDVLMNENE